MKLSISNIAWSAEYDAEMYAYLQQVGMNGLEIAPTRIFPDKPYQQLPAAKEWAKTINEKYGLVIPSMQSIWYGHAEKMFGSKEERLVLVDYTKQAICFAEAIGCENLVFGNPKNRDAECVSHVLDIAIDFFKEIGEYAVSHHTTVSLEPNPTLYHTRFMNYTEQAVEMAYKSGSEGIKVNVDLGTIICNEEDINYLKQVPEYIHHVHISEPGLNVIEHRELHKQLFSVLTSIGYDRFVSIEMGNKGDLNLVKQVIDYVQGI
jgi:sugar phosphate isomerase/epimerase